MPYTGSVVSLGFRLPRGDAPGSAVHSRGKLVGEALARQRHDPGDLLLHGEPGGVEQHRVGGGPERRDPAGRIGAVTRPERFALAAWPSAATPSTRPSRRESEA